MKRDVVSNNMGNGDKIGLLLKFNTIFIAGEGQTGLIIGIVVGVILGILILGVVVIIVVIIMKKIRHGSFFNQIYFFNKR